MVNLAKKHCTPCATDIPPLEGAELDTLVEELGGGWRVVNDHHLEKEYAFKDFKEALEFTCKLGALAEEEGHHPDIHLSWGKIRVLLWTHKIKGLSENDFVLAAKCDQLFTKNKQ